MRPQGLPRGVAEAILNALREDLGLSDLSVELAVGCLVEGSTEVRLGGKLGSGGKLYLGGDAWRLGVYADDRTSERDALIARGDARLAVLRRAAVDMGTIEET